MHKEKRIDSICTALLDSNQFNPSIQEPSCPSCRLAINPNSLKKQKTI